MSGRFNGPYRLIDNPGNDGALYSVIQPGQAYGITGPDGRLRFITYHCPCLNCGLDREGLKMALPVSETERDNRRKWHIEVGKDGLFTLSPSIQMLGDHEGSCRSHYFIKNGMVEWC